MATIGASVGRGGRNIPSDVKIVQNLINDNIGKLVPLAPLEDDGKVGVLTIGAIEDFQRKVVGMKKPDGRVDPGGRTIKALGGNSSPTRTLPNAGRISSTPTQDLDVDAFFERLDQQTDLAGSRVVYFDGVRMHVLREGPRYCAPGLKAVVIREPIETSALMVPEVAQARDSKMLTELLGVGLSCSAALLGWTVVLGSGGAAPITGGTSTFLTYLALGAATASSVQCVNAIGRTGMELFLPGELDQFDTNEWYQKTSLVLDAISLAGAVTATAGTVKLALSLKASTGKTMIQVLKGLSRQQRRKLAEEAVRIQNPGLSGKQLKAFVRAGVYPKRFTTLEINHSIRSQLIDAAGSAASYGGSAVSGVLREGGGLVFGIARSVETYR